MILTAKQIAQCIGALDSVAALWVDPLNETMTKYQINTSKRVAAFLAQLGHESGGLSRLVEGLNYSEAGLMKTWPGRFPHPGVAKLYARKPEKIANRVYSSRMGNGDEESGDGWLYRGRGPIQITGKDNYAAFEAATEYPVTAYPDLLCTDRRIGAASAGWFWDVRKLNKLADERDFEGITKRINGGLNGYHERMVLYIDALEALA